MAKPWEIDEALWKRIESLLPVHRPGTRGPVPLSDRKCLQGILFVLYTGINCLHRMLLSELHALGEIDWSAVCLDGSHVRAKKGAPERARHR